MQLYAQDSNDVVLPSRFDYREQRFAGKAASLPNTRFDISSSDIAPSAGRGTWADILWVRNCQAEADYVTSRRDPVDPSDPQLFRVRAPDSMVWNDPSESQNEGFGTLPNWDENPLRSKSKDVKTSPNSVGRTAPVPYGPGAGVQDVGAPGYFAANDWFIGCPIQIWMVNLGRLPLQWNRTKSGNVIGPQPLGGTSKSMYLVDSWRAR